MRQILQSLRDGETLLAEVPCAQVRPGHLLIQTRRTLISAGTERMLQEFGKAGWIGKARQQPEKVRQVLDKVRTDGLFATLDAVFDKLDEPLPLGYCNAGVVLEVGAGVSGFEPGDRVLSNGPHAEAVCVPQHLCSRIPDNVTDDEAVFGVLGAIALQGIRLANPTLGEAFLVSGLGLIGLLAVQLLKAHGVRVIGADFHAGRLALACEFGAETVHLGEGDLLSQCDRFSRGRGIDGVLITAATKSDEPLHQAATVCRKRGRIVLTGVAGLHLSRDDFYKKELSFQVSCSYGPGRYDPRYEEQGQDYPAAYVRWTEQRNFEAVLDMLAARQVTVQPLISHRFPFAEATAAYELIGGRQPSLGVLLDFAPADADALRAATIRFPRQPLRNQPRQTPVVGIIGAGAFATRHLFPALRAEQARLKWVATRSGVSAVSAAKRFQIEHATSDSGLVLSDPEVNVVVIATRHDSHADYVCRALDAGKHVFVEKPLALDRAEVAQIQRALSAAHRRGAGPVVMAGFNRRFAPQVVRMAELLRPLCDPKSFLVTVNAGELPVDHWLHDRQLGGGRLIGEGCHFIDLLRFLAGRPITQVHAVELGGTARHGVQDDKVLCTLQFADGSLGAIHYLASGHRSFPKERIEVFASGRVLQLDNFRRLLGYGWPSFRRQWNWRQDKGHRAGIAAFLKAVRDGQPSPIPWSELVEVTCVTADAAAAARRGDTVRYPSPAGVDDEGIPVPMAQPEAVSRELNRAG